MKPAIAIVLLLGVATGVLAKSPFDGTWRPDPQRPPANSPPDVLLIAQGTYKCDTCKPPVLVKADGVDHPVKGASYYDTLNVTVVDANSLKKVAKKGGQVVVAGTVKLSADGKSLTESRQIYGMAPHMLDVTSHSTRVAAGPAGSHAISGKWKLIESDLTNHDEDTTLEVKNGALSMTDKMGRSFTAKLDGTDAPYKGDPDFTTVSLKVVDARSIEEYDKKGGGVVKITRWKVDPDGKTMHVEFDDTHGRVQRQDGHKVE